MKIQPLYYQGPVRGGGPGILDSNFKQIADCIHKTRHGVRDPLVRSQMDYLKIKKRGFQMD